MPDTVEEMCLDMPRLDKLLKDVNDISDSGARYSDMPQVWEGLSHCHLTPRLPFITGKVL